MPPLGCLIPALGIDCPSCDDLKQIAGVDQSIYVGQISDLDVSNPFTVDADGNITDLNFITYKGLREYCGGRRFANGTNQELQVGETSASFFQHTVNFKLWSKNPEVKTVLNEVIHAEDIFIIVDNNNGTLEVFGLSSDPTDNNLGLRINQLTKASGVAQADDNSYNVAFTGPSQDLAPYFLDTDYATSKTKVISYIV